MHPDKIFLNVNAADFVGLSGWWRKLIGRQWDREPMPSCREWDLTNDVLLQVLDDPELKGTATVTILVADIDAEAERLRELGIELGKPDPVEGFDSLRYVRLRDPEGNIVGLLDGA